MLWFLKIAHFLLVCVGSATAVFAVLIDSMLGISFCILCVFGSGYCLHYLVQIEVDSVRENYLL
jgi:hypothetical protein